MIRSLCNRDGVFHGSKVTRARVFVKNYFRKEKGGRISTPAPLIRSRLLGRDSERQRPLAKLTRKVPLIRQDVNESALVLGTVAIVCA